MANALSGSTLYANNEVITYMPNSLIYDIGSPERIVAPQVVGNGAVENVTTEDFSTSKGKITFDLKTTSENEEVVQTWIDNVDSNVFRIVSSDDKSRNFQGAVVINKPEFDTGADGVISIEIESARAVVA